MRGRRLHIRYREELGRFSGGEGEKGRKGRDKVMPGMEGGKFSHSA
jgi:hypothetical protein